MSKVQIELESQGIRELLKSDELAEVCEREAERMTRATGMEYSPKVWRDEQRVKVRAYKKKQWPLCPKCGKAHPRCRCKNKIEVSE